jgi:hypothetical protein
MLFSDWRKSLADPDSAEYPPRLMTSLKLQDVIAEIFRAMNEIDDL